MGKSQKYTEDQLLEGVVKYSDFYKRKIKATELAKWCRLNVPGLEEVRDYHFKRTIKERDLKTGKMLERQKLCTRKIEEINKSRSLRVSIGSNLIFRASNIDVIFQQSQLTQKKLIVEARETFGKLLSKNYQLERENEDLKRTNKEYKASLNQIDNTVCVLQKEIKKVTKQVNYLMKEVDLENRKEMLEKIGVKDEAIDLNVYVENLQQSLDEVMNIKNVLIGQSKNSTIVECEKKRFAEDSVKVKQSFVENVTKGIDFD